MNIGRSRRKIISRHFARDFEYGDSLWEPLASALKPKSGNSSRPQNKKSVRDNKEVCPDCGRTYQFKTSLINHLKFECGKDPQFKCLFCKYKAKLKGNIKGHMMRLHNAKYIQIKDTLDL